MNSLITKLVAIATLFALLAPSTYAMGDKLFLNTTCDSAGDQNYSCDLPKRRGGEGFFVCRTRYHPLTGTENKFPVCIPSGRAMEGDECGCCGVDVSACPQPCGCACALRTNRKGVVKKGVFVVSDDMDEPECVRTAKSMRLVARSINSDMPVTCLAAESAECIS